MKRNTRQEILETAKEMFNDRGYNAVSIGDIAKALGISKGNLTYHFKRKEEIMEALINSETPKFPERVPDSFEELDAFLLHIQQVREDNAFYFWNHTQLGQLSLDIKDKQTKVYRCIHKILTETFYKLTAKNLIRPEAIQNEYARISDTILMMSIYWLPFQELMQAHGKNENYRIHAWTLVCPLLTVEGKKVFQELHIFEQ